MESKFSTFLIFVTLAQSCLAAKSTLYGLSEENDAVLKQIIVNQEATVVAKFDGFDPVFTMINGLASGLIFNMTSENSDTESIVETACNSAIDAIDYSMDAMLLASGRPCEAAETARQATHDNLYRLYDLVPKALELVVSGKYKKGQSEFDEIQSISQQELADLVESVFGSMPGCWGITDEDTLATIKTAASGSDEGLFYTINSVFNAIKLLADALYAGSADTSLVFAIKELQDNSRIRLRTDVEHKFSLIKAVFLKDKLNLDTPASVLFPIQYAQTVSTYRFETGNEALLETVKNQLKSLDLELSAVGRSEFSSTDVAKAATTAYVKAGFSILVDSVAETDSIASDVLSTFREYFDDYTEAKVAKLYSTSDTIQEGDTLSDVLAAIDAQEEEYELDRSAADHVAKISDLILNGKQYGDDVRAKISSIQAEEIDALHNYATVFYNLARATARTRFDTEGESEAYPAVIAATRDALFDAIRLFTHKIAELRIIVNSAETLKSWNPIHMLVRTLPLWF